MLAAAVRRWRRGVGEGGGGRGRTGDVELVAVASAATAARGVWYASPGTAGRRGRKTGRYFVCTNGGGG